MREILRRAILTMGMMPDPDDRFLGWAKAQSNIVRDAREAYGWAPASVRRFTPTPHDIAQAERLEPWLAWLRREKGENAWRRLLAWSLDAPLWRLSQREGCSERTVWNRINQSVADVIHKFAGVHIPVEYGPSDARMPTYSLIFERPNPTSDQSEFAPMKIYVGGRGIWRAGKWLRNERGEVEMRKVG